MRTLFHNSNSDGKRLEQARDKAHHACAQLSEDIERANTFRMQYLNELWPEACGHMRALEKTGVDLIKRVVEDFAASTQHASARSELASQARAFVAELEEGSLELTGEHAATRALLASPLEYDLGTRPADLAPGAFLGPDASLFNNTLAGCLKLEEQRHATAFDGRVPALLPTLTAAIQANGGFSTKGIFRESAKSEDLAALRARLELGNYFVGECSPHLPAGALKAWLGGLTEPIVPFDKYERCLELGRLERVQARDVADLVASLPSLHRAVLTHLVVFLGEMLQPTCVAATLMTATNLAVVFGPGERTLCCPTM